MCKAFVYYIGQVLLSLAGAGLGALLGVAAVNSLGWSDISTLFGWFLIGYIVAIVLGGYLMYECRPENRRYDR